MAFFDSTLGIFIIILAQCLAMIGFVMVSLLLLVYGDRKIWGAVQMRRGPNVVGPWGILQSVADALKYILKEVIVPAGSDKVVFFLAPLASFVLAIIAWAVIPFSETWVVANLNVAVLYVFAVSSLEVYGVIMGGWASNSKYPFLGALRSAAQMISYEVSIGFIIIGVIISTGSLSFVDIVKAQDGAYGIFNWYWLPHFPMVFLFFISALAETNRPPFDLPEAESELVAGYQVEYSSTPFLLFMAGEYIAIWLMCALCALLFFGGWLSPIPALPDSPLWLVAKMAVVFFLFSMVKAIVPRYRYDQLMRLGWKVFLPMSLIWVVIVAGSPNTKPLAEPMPVGLWEDNFAMNKENKTESSSEALTMMNFENNKKSEGVAFLLWFFLGLFGAHRFYLKQVASAVIMLVLTLTFFGIIVTAIWWVIDAFLITGMTREHNQKLIDKIK